MPKDSRVGCRRASTAPHMRCTATWKKDAVEQCGRFRDESRLVACQGAILILLNAIFVGWQTETPLICCTPRAGALRH